MAYQALYRQYRPQSFDDVVEQQHVVKTLKNTVISKKTAHAYLFCGTRGTGKTTMAKLFARALNCLNPKDGNPCNLCEVCEGIINGTILDVTEIDAASNNSVDNVRSIIDEVVYTPTKAAKKVYIIDEVHMLSSGAFNALLKTLEEPPEHVVFILATTEPHKLPATVLSRCQRFDFRRISIDGIAERLQKIVEEIGISITKEALYFIASLAEGALRDGISILDQCIATGKTTMDLNLVQEVAGIASGRLVLDTVKALNERNVNESILNIDRLFSEGKDSGHFLQKVIQLYRDILVYKSSGSTDNLLSMTDEIRTAIPALTKIVSFEETLAIVRVLSDLETGIKWSTSPRILLETAFMRICSREISKDEDALSEKIKLLENRIRALEEGVPVNTEKTVYNNIISGQQSIKAEAPNTELPKHTDKKRNAKVIEVEYNKEKTVASNTAKTFSEWDKVLQELKDKGRRAVVANLDETEAVWAGNDTIGVVIPEGEAFKKRVLSKAENVEAIEEALKNVSGKSLKFRINTVESDMTKEDVKDELPDKLLQFAKDKGIEVGIIDE
ncbi:MAG: DNA polymerase III subunit gamma/tau [Ruminiclostridium sp.]|nr:DNA polymerase III subunit gamma/tau [Ruminiclostridium sp.]